MDTTQLDRTSAQPSTILQVRNKHFIIVEWRQNRPRANNKNITYSTIKQEYESSYKEGVDIFLDAYITRYPTKHPKQLSSCLIADVIYFIFSI